MKGSQLIEKEQKLNIGVLYKGEEKIFFNYNLRWANVILVYKTKKNEHMYDGWYFYFNS